MTCQVGSVIGSDTAPAGVRSSGISRYELWRSKPLGEGCAAPCRSADVLIMRWRWDTPRDEQQFAAKLEQFGELNDAIVTRRGGEVTLVIAPPGVAERVAGGA